MFLFTHLFEMIYEAYTNEICIKTLTWSITDILTFSCKLWKYLRNYFLIFKIIVKLAWKTIQNNLNHSCHMKIQCHEFHLITLNFFSFMQITSNVVSTYKGIFQCCFLIISMTFYSNTHDICEVDWNSHKLEKYSMKYSLMIEWNIICVTWVGKEWRKLTQNFFELKSWKYWKPNSIFCISPENIIHIPL